MYRNRLVVLSLGLLLFLLFGCRYLKGTATEQEAAHPRINKIVVFGFIPALAAGESPALVRIPLSGTISMAEPVSQKVVDNMTSRLFDKMLEIEDYELISPARSRSVYLDLLQTDIGRSDEEIFRKLGETFSADAVLAGYFYRWYERKGTAYAVDLPASVAFDLYLVRPSDGEIIWKKRFDKTQQSLTENILDVKTFIKGGGKWMTAQELAELGLNRTLEELQKKQD